MDDFQINMKKGCIKRIYTGLGYRFEYENLKMYMAKFKAKKNLTG